MIIKDAFFEKEKSEFPDCVLLEIDTETTYVFRFDDPYVRPELRNIFIRELSFENNYYTALGTALCNKGGLPLLDSVPVSSPAQASIFTRIKNIFISKKDEVKEAEILE